MSSSFSEEDLELRRLYEKAEATMYNPPSPVLMVG